MTDIMSMDGVLSSHAMAMPLLKLVMLSLTLDTEGADVPNDGVSQKCTLPYERCAGDPCPDEAPLMCNEGRTCLDESLICNGECFCQQPHCLDESAAECTKKKYRAVKRVLVIGGALLAIPVAIVVSYYFCCGGIRKRNRLMGSILSDHTSQQQQHQQQQQQQENEQQTMIPGAPLNIHSRTNSMASARSRSNSAAESTRSESSRSLRTGRPSGHNLRRHRPQRTFGIDNPQTLEPFLTANRSSTRSLGQRVPRDRRYGRELQVGGSLRLPSPRHSSCHRNDESVESYFRLLADAPPSYSDSCINNQSEACVSRSRDLLMTEGEEPPPSYNEVLEKKFPMFGSFNEIQTNEARDQVTTRVNTNDVSIVVESAI